MAYTRVNKVFVAGDISSTATVQIDDPATSGTYIAEGEIVVLDKNKDVLSAGSTVGDTDTIYIAFGTDKTFSYVNEAGTSITGARVIEFSDPIEGKNVLDYVGNSYAAPTQAVATIDAGLTPVVGEEYGIRIVYKDLYQHPGQFTHTYRELATSTSLSDLFDAFEAQINGHSGARVTAVATTGPDLLTLTAKAVDDNETVESINEYSQVNFEVFLVTDNFGTSEVAYTANPSRGYGYWKLVRDAEKHALSYKGITNRTHFPVIKPDLRTVKDETYDQILIIHSKSYTQANSQYEATTPLRTEIYLPVGAGQTTTLLGILNPWMASLPQSFSNVTV
jgi:hypothetical protein